MPELPDVELARRRLRANLRGGVIAAAGSNDARLFRPQSPRALARALVGRTVREVDRRGKWLRVRLDDGARLFSHLGMTGQWVTREAGDAHTRSERAHIEVRRGKRGMRSLRYLDARRFGRLIVARDDIPEWQALGPDPLLDGISIPKLAAALARSRRTVKAALMDQSILAGVGNILATEALWHARIDPRSASDALTRRNVTQIVRGLRKAIREELDARSAATSDDWEDVFAVYGHAGKPCPRCGTSIARAVVAGRTTTFCPHCQVRRKA